MGVYVGAYVCVCSLNLLVASLLLLSLLLQIWCYDWTVNIFKSEVPLLFRVPNLSSFQSIL